LNTTAGKAQSVQRRAMGCTVLGSNTGEGVDIPHPSSTSLGPPSLLNIAHGVIAGSKVVGTSR